MSIVIGTYRELARVESHLSATGDSITIGSNRVAIISFRFRGADVVLRETSTGIWEDEHGVPFETPLDPGCTIHDYIYSSPVFQLFHTRRQADDYMRYLQRRAVEHVPMRRFWYGVIDVFHGIARKLGAPFWENEKTR